MAGQELQPTLDWQQDLILAQHIGGIKLHIDEEGTLEEFLKKYRAIACPGCGALMQETDTYGWGCSNCGMEVPARSEKSRRLAA